jgi:hypothetical protein
MASKQQRLAMQADPRCGRLLPRSPRPAHCGGAPEGGALSAFTSYIARDDLATAISKYRASNCRDAYYLLTEVGGTKRLGGGGWEKEQQRGSAPSLLGTPLLAWRGCKRHCRLESPALKGAGPPAPSLP